MHRAQRATGKTFGRLTPPATFRSSAFSSRAVSYEPPRRDIIDAGGLGQVGQAGDSGAGGGWVREPARTVPLVRLHSLEQLRHAQSLLRPSNVEPDPRCEAWPHN